MLTNTLGAKNGAMKFFEIRRYLIPVLTAAAVLAAAGEVQAKVPDEDDIVTRIMDAQSEYYYPNLMMRYRSGDTTFTEEHYHYL